jgi:hypothetical protein
VRWGPFLAVVVWSTTVLAATPIPREGSPPIVICYWTKAIVAGVSKCDPPSTLVGAVFGGCSDLENQVRQQVLDDPRNTDALWQKREIAEIAVRHIHEIMSSQVQGWILDAQTSDQSVCRHPQ